MGSKQTKTLNNNISYTVTLPNSTSVLPEKYYLLPPAANYISGWIKAHNFNLIVRQIFVNDPTLYFTLQRRRWRNVFFIKGRELISKEQLPPWMFCICSFTVSTAFERTRTTIMSNRERSTNQRK